MGCLPKVDWATEARVKRLSSLRYVLSNIAVYGALTMVPGSEVGEDGSITQRNPCKIYNTDDTQFVSVADGAAGKENVHVFPSHMTDEHIRTLSFGRAGGRPAAAAGRECSRRRPHSF